MPEWMQTYSGRRFYVADPIPPAIHIDDIAAALSKMCRYGGHCLHFYSVAEHCVHVAAAAPKGMRLTALMHDASEAYLVDVPRPVKPFLVGYYDLEGNLMATIAKRFGFEWPLPPEVKRLDNAILADERAQNMAPMPEDAATWGCSEPPLGVRLQFWNPHRAEFEFRAAFHRYHAIEGGAHV